MTTLQDVGVRDVGDKWVVICRMPGGSGPVFSLLWRTEGKRGRPLPKVGSHLQTPAGHLVVERIDPPGSLDLAAYPGGKLIVKP